MSDFKFNCPSCNQSIICDVSNAGMQIPCPVCQAPITVPRPAPAAPTPPTGNKLSINKAAHQAHAAPAAPPPGAASAPAQPAWGTKPAPVRPKKKVPWVPISVVAGVLIVAAVGWFGFGAPYLKQQEEKKKQAEEAARIQAEEQAKAAAEAAKAKAKPTWKLDLATAQFPTRAAIGKHHGVDFTVETAVFSSGSLALVQTSGTPRQFIVTLPLKAGETIAGRTFEVMANSTNATGQPRVTMGWKDEGSKVPGVLSFTKGFAMKLEFGTVANGQLPGKIYLCLPDPDQSFVGGTFQIGSKNPAGQSAPAGGTPPPGGANRRRGS